MPTARRRPTRPAPPRPPRRRRGPGDAVGVRLPARDPRCVHGHLDLAAGPGAAPPDVVAAMASHDDAAIGEALMLGGDDGVDPLRRAVGLVRLVGADMVVVAVRAVVCGSRRRRSRSAGDSVERPISRSSRASSDDGTTKMRSASAPSGAPWAPCTSIFRMASRPKRRPPDLVGGSRTSYRAPATPRGVPRHRAAAGSRRGSRSGR